MRPRGLRSPLDHTRSERARSCHVCLVCIPTPSPPLTRLLSSVVHKCTHPSRGAPGEQILINYQLRRQPSFLLVNRLWPDNCVVTAQFPIHFPIAIRHSHYEFLKSEDMIVKSKSDSWDITNFGAILFAKSLSDFSQLELFSIKEPLDLRQSERNQISRAMLSNTKV